MEETNQFDRVARQAKVAAKQTETVRPGRERRAIDRGPLDRFKEEVGDRGTALLYKDPVARQPYCYVFVDNKLLFGYQHQPDNPYPWGFTPTHDLGELTLARKMLTEALEAIDRTIDHAAKGELKRFIQPVDQDTDSHLSSDELDTSTG